MEIAANVINTTTLRPLLAVTATFTGLSILLLVVIIILHTLHLLGTQTLLYRTRPPVAGWSKRFYPACLFMIVALLLMMQLLNTWSHILASSS